MNDMLETGERREGHVSRAFVKVCTEWKEKSCHR